MPLCDAHCHLQDERLTPYLDQALEIAAGNDVSTFICCGSEETDWPAVQALADSRRSIKPQFGLHPWYVAGKSTSWLKTLQGLLESNPDAGVGEIGLDHAITERNDADQLAAFTAQLQLASNLCRPISIHCRKAWDAMLETLRRFQSFPKPIVFHSFSGSADLVPSLIKLGGYISFSGSITFSGNKRGRKALAAVPLDRLLIETDSPDLHPNIEPRLKTTEGKPINEPGNLIHVLRTTSAISGISTDQLKLQLWQNAKTAFDLQ